jgi:hypothetical protein
MERIYWPFLKCLDEISFSNLKYAAWRNHHKKIAMPETKIEILNFDADAEMRKRPESENHMKET